MAGSTTTVYVFSGSKVIAEYVNSALGKEYVYAGGTLLATYEGATLKYHQGDHLSVRLTTDAAGTILAQQGHYPFGEAWYSGAGSTKWQFTSYERDGESGLDYATFRYDSTRVGRFTSPDLLAGDVIDAQSLNRYAYVLDDPINLTDPLGLVTIRISIEGGGGGGGGGGGFCGLLGGPQGDICILRLLPISIDDRDDGGDGGGGGGGGFGPCAPGGLVSGPFQGMSQSVPYTFIVDVWVMAERICGDFVCDERGIRGLAPREIRGIQPTNIEFALLLGGSNINNNPFLRIGPGYVKGGVRILRVSSGGPRLPWWWHIWNGPRWPF